MECPDIISGFFWSPDIKLIDTINYFVQSSPFVLHIIQREFKNHVDFSKVQSKFSNF